MLRRRLAGLLWAVIRASMSSSPSSSENSCGWQRSDLIKGEMASGKLAKAALYVFPHSSSVWADAASFHDSIRRVRTERGNLFTRFSRAKSQCLWVYSKLASMNGWVSCVSERPLLRKALWMQMNTQRAQRQSRPILTIRSSTCFSAYSRLDACHALWSELWSAINIQPHVWRITSSSSAHRYST